MFTTSAPGCTVNTLPRRWYREGRILPPETRIRMHSRALNSSAAAASGFKAKSFTIYQSGPCRVWIKVRDHASIAVQRERSENWNR